MDAYIYKGALYCRSCATDIARSIMVRRGSEEGVNFDDSDTIPQGPYPDGGGKADSPQYCDKCGEFLRNPLTSEGVRYVRQAVQELEAEPWKHPAARMWRTYYAQEVGE
jgi:hypothetical protein